MTNDTPSRNLHELKEMMLRGSAYRSEFETEVLGSPFVLVFKPIIDEYYFPLLARLDGVVGLSESEALQEMEDALEDADYEAVNIDTSRFDAEFMNIMKDVCRRGIAVEDMDGDEETLETILANSVGGYYIQWAYEIMDVTGNLEDAKKFRGGRNGE